MFEFAGDFFQERILITKTPFKLRPNLSQHPPFLWPSTPAKARPFNPAIVLDPRIVATASLSVRLTRPREPSLSGLSVRVRHTPGSIEPRLVRTSYATNLYVHSQHRSIRMADMSAESIQQKIQIARRDAEALKDRIKRKKDELADTTRKCC